MGRDDGGTAECLRPFACCMACRRRLFFQPRVSLSAAAWLHPLRVLVHLCGELSGFETFLTNKVVRPAGALHDTGQARGGGPLLWILLGLRRVKLLHGLRFKGIDPPTQPTINKDACQIVEKSVPQYPTSSHRTAYAGWCWKWTAF